MAEIFPKRLAIVSRQVDQLRVLWQALIPPNKFYSEKFNTAIGPRGITHLQHFATSVPLSTQAEMVQNHSALAADPGGARHSPLLHAKLRHSSRGNRRR